ncbi:hypothetical protein CK203_016598 [Vitis vinifera]|uniref:Uncharacterized protein n=1 Tax=Vitis vinifera TaxID=29760 RepID=A0A438J2I2_VITVI|nr:hypothetical protein CK203_016598 [Vitis vinifera]
MGTGEIEGARAECKSRGSRSFGATGDLQEEQTRMWEMEKKLEGKWRVYSMVRDENRGGCYIRLGVVDLENKNASIFIPKGRGAVGGWTSMIESLRRLDIVRKGDEGKKHEEQSRSVREKEISRNLEKLGHCLVGSWNPRSGRGDDLKAWGTLLGKRLGTEGPRKHYGKRVLSPSGKMEARDGVHAGRGKRREAWVRIVGLPVSLWDQAILRRIGEECGGFLAIDPQTERLEELQWARILAGLEGSIGRAERVEECCSGRGWGLLGLIQMLPKLGRHGVGRLGCQARVRGLPFGLDWPTTAERARRRHFFFLVEEHGEDGGTKPCGVPKTDGALMEEAQRYGNTSSLGGLLVRCSFFLSSFFQSDPFGVLRLLWCWLGGSQRDPQGCIVNGLGFMEQRAVANWELMEASNGSNGEGGEELRLIRTETGRKRMGRG